MDEPAELKKYLGCVHEIAYKTCGGERVMKVTFNMTNYIQSALDQYAGVSKGKISKADSPYAPRLADDDMEKLHSVP